MASQQLSEWSAGSVIGGRYRIAGILGRGGMGIVYAAEDLKLHGKLRAIKAPGGQAGNKRSFAEEAEVLMKLSHPHLPQIVDYSPPNEEGPAWFAMDYIPGDTIATLIRERARPIPFTDIIRIALQLCSALAYMHGQSPPVIHRDLKPSNVMIDKSGYVRLIDFGIARSYKPEGGEDTELLGTPGFAAPEQQGGSQSGVWTDVYGLGALLYYMATGGRRYEGAGRRGEPWKWLKPDIPVPFRRVLERMLDEVPSRRYVSMDDAAAALQSILPEEQGRSPREPGMTASGTFAVHVLSLSGGTGGSFIAVTLAKLLAKQGVKVAAAEHPLVRPEWHALIGGGAGRLWRKGPAVRAADASDSRYMTWTNADNVLWHGLKPDGPADWHGGGRESFELMLQAVSASVTVIDRSAYWEEEAARKELLDADAVVIVADPFPSKWRAARLELLRRLTLERGKDGKYTVWIANKDMPFRGRLEWLDLLPPEGTIRFPLMPAAEVCGLVWKGLWMTDDKKMAAAAERALRPLLDGLKRRLRTRAGRL